MNCWKCHSTHNLPSKPGRLDLCPSCNAFLHCCNNCLYFDKNSHNSCKEPQAERVIDKKNANFCGYFKFNTSPNTQFSDSKRYLSKEDASKKWDELFKKK